MQKYDHNVKPPKSRADENHDGQKTSFCKKDMVTVYGRQTCREVLQDQSLKVFRLHLSKSNRASDMIDELTSLANKRGIEICYHNRSKLSYISRNGREDQGVVCDIKYRAFEYYRKFLSKQQHHAATTLIALDGITNPQNLGMIIRSVVASNVSSILLPTTKKNLISPLAIKASAGTVFKSNILRCENLANALRDFQKRGYKVVAMESHAKQTIDKFKVEGPIIYVLGNETDGLSEDIINIADYKLSIALQRGVESLNVAVAAALVAFMLA